MTGLAPVPLASRAPWTRTSPPQFAWALTRVPAPRVSLTPGGMVSEAQPPASTGGRLPDQGSEELTARVSPPSRTPLRAVGRARVAVESPHVE